MDTDIITNLKDVPESVFEELSNGSGGEESSDDDKKSAATPHTNSPLVEYTKISPNKTIMKNKVIDTITIHCVAGQCSIEVLGDIFAPVSRRASSNYGVGPDGRIGMYVEEKDRAWTSSSSANDSRAITIEVASNSKAPFAVRDAAFNSLIKLLVDICKRNNIKKLLWKNDKSLIGQVDKQNMTVHRWFSDTACPGEYLLGRHDEIAKLVNAELKVKDLTKQFKIGGRYEITRERPVRKGPGVKYDRKKHRQLNPIAKTKDKDKDGALDKGSRITCKELKQKGTQTVWMRCGAGWIKVLNKDGQYVKEVTK